MNPVVAFFFNRSQNVLEQQQTITYTIAVGLAVMGMSLHLLHILGSSAMVLRALSMCVLAICVPTFILWLKGRVRVTKAFAVTGLAVQAVQVLKILYIAYALPPDFSYLVALNGVISLAIMMLLEVCYLRFSCIFVGVTNVAVLIYVGNMMQSKPMWQLVILVSLFTVFFIFMGDLMYRNVKQIHSENSQYQLGERQLLHTLRLNRNEVEAYLAICRKHPGDKKDLDQLFSMLSERSQHNVISAVDYNKTLKAIEKDNIKNVLPDFTPMELEIARLVMLDMKLSQIIDATGKSESNVSVVRSRIRKKLGLKPGDDLREALLNKLKDYQEENG